MDPLIENMLNGFKGTIDHVVGTVGEENGATIRAIFCGDGIFGRRKRLRHFYVPGDGERPVQSL
jgi:hypothetical protein